MLVYEHVTIYWSYGEWQSLQIFMLGWVQPKTVTLWTLHEKKIAMFPLGHLNANMTMNILIITGHCSHNFKMSSYSGTESRKGCVASWQKSREVKCLHQFIETEVWSQSMKTFVKAEFTSNQKRYFQAFLQFYPQSYFILFLNMNVCPIYVSILAKGGSWLENRLMSMMGPMHW